MSKASITAGTESILRGDSRVSLPTVTPKLFGRRRALWKCCFTKALPSWRNACSTMSVCSRSISSVVSFVRPRISQATACFSEAFTFSRCR